LGRIPIGIPPIHEQRAIVRFLDEKTAKIDALIDKKLELIQLVAQAHRAVLDDVCSSLRHAPHLRLKSLTRMITSGSRGWAAHYSESGEPFLRVGNVTSNSIDLELSSLQFVHAPTGAEAVRTRADPGDLVLSITAAVGRVGVVPPGFAGYVNQHLALVKPRRSTDTRWIAWYLASSFGQSQFLQLLYGGSKDGLGLDDVANLTVPMPEPSDQTSALREIDKSFRMTSNTTNLAYRVVERLHEYRSALITAAVSGQIDVTEAA
jgi:type I restriction enzyme S subunit